jgi:hypothetical protein
LWFLVFLGVMERMTMWMVGLGFFALASAVPASPLQGTVDESLVGHLHTLEGTELASMTGWAPEEVLDLGEGRAVVLWRSLPRRNYLRIELWAPSGDSYRRTWPGEDDAEGWYQGEARLRPNGSTRELLLSHAVVAENFEAPLLRRHRVYRIDGERLVLAGERVAKALTDSQRVNLAALRVAEGDVAGARKVAAGLRGREPRARAAVARSQAPGAAHDTALREELQQLAGRNDRAGKQAAGAWLKLVLSGSETTGGPER